MRVLARLDCYAGVAGDMLVGALVDVGAPFAVLERAVAALGLEGVRITHAKTVRGGVTATKFSVELDRRRRAHRGLSDLLTIVARAQFAGSVQSRIERTLTKLAEAEATVHGTTVDAVHFHEVGADDAIVDVVCACVALDSLGVHSVEASPVEIGHGTVQTEHGILPVPAPATALLLADREVSQAEVGEATTPTGAALLVGWDAGPIGAAAGPLRQAGIGYGAGDREVIGRPNVVRVRLLRSKPNNASGRTSGLSHERICQLECQVDTATGERLGYVLHRLVAAGALDAYVVPILMKKGRPGHLLTAWSDEAHRDAVRDVLLEDATTLGVRLQWVERACLERWSIDLESRWGLVRAKAMRLPSGVVLARPEADEVARLVTAGHGSYASIETELLALANARVTAQRR